MNKTDLILIIPQNSKAAKILSISAGITHPLGVAYIAAYLKQHSYSVKILDNTIEALSDQEIKKFIKQSSPRYVGLSMLTPAVNQALSIAETIKEAAPDTKIFAGGVHASSLPQEILKNDHIDIIVKGEGEETTLELLQTLDKKENLKNISGIIYKEKTEIKENPDRPLIKNLDDLPYPAYELLSMDKYYLPASRRLTTKKIASIITGRGCPYKCTFCSHNAIFKAKVRLRTPENVLTEIKHLVKNFGVGELIIWDDCFTLDADRAIEIARFIKAENLNLTFSCSSRVDRASDKLFSNLYQAGCREILFGVESGSQEILNDLKKGTSVPQIEKAIALCKKHQMLAGCSFLFGTPKETKETIKETFKLLKKIEPDISMFCLLTPLPGSQLFDQVVEKRLLDIEKTNWDNFVTLLSAYPQPVNLCGLSQKELLSTLKKAYRSFYLTPKYILKNLKKIHSLKHFKELFRGFLAVLKYQLAKIS